MGLDIYLYRYEDRADTERLEAEYQKREDEIWDWDNCDYDNMSQDQRDAKRERCKAAALELGLDESGDDPRKVCIKEDSKLYPDHLFELGYFRSSYNDGGINSKLRMLLDGADLHDLFPVEDGQDEYVRAVDWQVARERTDDMLTRLKERVAGASYDVIEVSANPYGYRNEPIDSQAAALDCFLKERASHTDSSFPAYSNANGTFYMKEPIKVVGLIEGITRSLGERSAVYVVYEYGDGYDWYIHALEIVIETIDYVLAQPDPEKYFLHWSG